MTKLEPIPLDHRELDIADDQDAVAFDFDFHKIQAMLFREKFTILAIMLSTLLLGLAITLLMTPKYSAKATVQIENEAARVLDTEDLSPVQQADTERFLKTQVEVLRSRSLAIAVMRDMRLQGNAPFLEKMNYNKSIEKIGSLSIQESEREVILALLMENTEITLPVDSRLVSIRFVSPDPVLAAQIANSFAENFIKENLQRRFDTSAYAREFLTTQLTDAKRRLEESEREAIAYARSAQLIDTSNGESKTEGGGPKSLTTATLIQLNEDYSTALADRLRAEEKWQQARSGNLMAMPEALSNTAVQRLVEARARAEAQYRDELAIRTDEHPTVRRIAAQVLQLNAEISRLGGQIRSSLKEQYDVALRQEKSIERKLSQLKSESLSEQDRTVQLSILQRATDTNRGLYDALLQRYRELSAEAGIQVNNISIIDRADTPTEPVSPRLFVNLALAGFGGLALALLTVFVRAQLDDNIRSPEDLRAKLALPLLGAIPPSPATSNVALELADPKSPISEAYNSVRASLLLASRDGLARSIAVTSAQPSEGKTSTVFAIAQGLGRIDRRVVVVDLDMRRPALHKAYNVGNDVGVSEFLAGSVTDIRKLINSTELQNVSLVTCGRIPPNPTELLSGESIKRFISELSAIFDVVILDAPPILGLADAVILGALAEGTVFVVEAGRNRSGNSKVSVQRLLRNGAIILGAILTKYDARSSGYGYGYGYNYNYHYKYSNEATS